MVTTVCSKVTRDFDTLGAHTLRWRYVRDSNGSGGDNAGWVDCVEWTPASSSSDNWDEIQYAYDASGRRVAKDVDGVLTKYLYDGDQCIAEYDANDTLLRKYIYGPGIDQPICMTETSGAYADTYYYHYDALGSVVALSDADGDTVQVYEYDVFGQVAASDANHPNPFTFTGRRYDAETGLYYYRARYYNPTIGRFLQTDPIGYDGGMNLYGYCANNSLNCVDPLGLDWTFGTGSNDLLGYYWDGDGCLIQLTGTYNFQGVASAMEENPANISVEYVMDSSEPNKVVAMLFWFSGTHEYWEIGDNWDPTAGDRTQLAVDVAEDVLVAANRAPGNYRFPDLIGLSNEVLQEKYREARKNKDFKEARRIRQEQKRRGASQSSVKKIIYTTGGAMGEALREAWEDPSLSNSAVAGGIVVGGTVIVIGAVLLGMAGFGS